MSDKPQAPASLRRHRALRALRQRRGGNGRCRHRIEVNPRVVARPLVDLQPAAVTEESPHRLQRVGNLLTNRCLVSAQVAAAPDYSPAGEALTSVSVRTVFTGKSTAGY